MSNRINLKEVQPKAYIALAGLQSYVKQANIDPEQKILIGLRVSEINDCQLCLDLHIKEAKELGMTDQRIYSVSSWRQSNLFTEIEKSILSLAEEVTYIYNGVNEETYSKASLLLGEIGLAEALLTIVTINGLNRLAVSTKQLPILN